MPYTAMPARTNDRLAAGMPIRIEGDLEEDWWSPTRWVVLDGSPQQEIRLGDAQLVLRVTLAKPDEEPDVHVYLDAQMARFPLRPSRPITLQDLDPGVHVLIVAAEGHEPVQHQVLLDAGERRTLDVALPLRR